LVGLEEPRLLRKAPIFRSIMTNPPALLFEGKRMPPSGKWAANIMWDSNYFKESR
jgi:hypothetical protein